MRSSRGTRTSSAWSQASEISTPCSRTWPCWWKLRYPLDTYLIGSLYQLPYTPILIYIYIAWPPQVFHWVPLVHVSLSVRAQPACFLHLQGDLVDNIERSVSNAAEYTSSAKEETKKAVRWQKKSRRVRLNDALQLLLMYIIHTSNANASSSFQKYIILAFALLLLLAVLALIVGLSVGLIKRPV